LKEKPLFFEKNVADCRKNENQLLKLQLVFGVDFQIFRQKMRVV